MKTQMGTSSANLLNVDRLSVRFGGILALSEISFAVRPGEIVGVIGPNGSGKTTLLNCISGVIAATGGGIRFEGRPIDRRSAHWRSRHGIRRTFQNVALFEGMSVLDNLRVGADHGLGNRADPTEDDDIAERLVEELGLSSYRGASVQSLSMGYRKRVEIARALAGAPKLLLLDEASAGIRPKDMSAIMGLIDQTRAQRGMSVVLVEHDMAVLMAASDRVIALDFGRLIANGSPEEVQQDEVVQAAYLGGVA